MDFEALADEIAANGTTYGFLNTTDSLLIGTGADPEFIDPDGEGPLPPLPTFQVNPAVAGLDEDQFVFYDLLHPTTAAHGVFGAFQAAVLAGDNVEFLGDGRNFEYGSSGDDLFFAQGGNDLVFGGGGEDAIFGGDGRDFLLGGAESDILAGGEGNDIVFGGSDSDVLAGNGGNDRLTGGAGADALIDGLGSDRAFGGSGDDVFFYAEGSLIGGENGADRDIFFGGSGDDTLFLVVSEQSRASVEDDLSGIGESVPFLLRFSDLGLITIGIENVVLLDSRADFDTVEVSDDLQARLDEAEFFNLV